MAPQPLPRDLRQALRLLEAEPARPWRIGELAAACGTAPRTLQKRFRAFLGCGPVHFLRDLRLDNARRALLPGPGRARITEIAASCGFNHLGRFSTLYSRRFGESPSKTLQRCRRVPAPAPPFTARTVDRTTIAVLPFDLIGLDAGRAQGIAEEIAAALCQARWLGVTSPAAARYHLRGKVRSDDAGRLRVTVLMTDAGAGRHLWADTFDGTLADLFAFEERTAVRIACAIQPSLRGAEIDRARRKDRAALNAWELTMRALGCVLSFEPRLESLALELFDEAMERAPQDPLPAALASWCRGLRGGHHFTPRPTEERTTARILADRAATLAPADSLAETLLASGYTLAHDLAAADFHADRALRLDGGSAWAWGRSGWIKAYGGQHDEAIERFQIARALAPDDPLAFLWAIGIGSAQLERARPSEAVAWYTRALRERPTALWNNRFLAAAHALAGHKHEARRTFADFNRSYPDVTIAQVRIGLPHTTRFLDFVADGLESAGMRP